MSYMTKAALVFILGLVPPVIAQTVSQTDYSRQAIRMLQSLVGGRFAAVEVRFNPGMAKELPQDKLASRWKEFAARVGPFEKVIATDSTSEPGGYYVVTLLCQFQRNRTADALVVFDKSGRIAGLYFGPQQTETVKEWTTPKYAHLGRFHEIPITVADGLWHLPGTLTVPNGNGPFPAVVLVPGSPPMDQDETDGPNKIFKDLAWGLASRGIAVLRYTKRTHQFGAGLGGGQVSSFSLRGELLDDARAAVAVVAQRSDVDHRRTYLLGHSMGGIAVSKLAGADPRIAGIIVMGTPSDDVLGALIARIEHSAGGGAQSDQQVASMIGTLRKLRDGGFAAGETVNLFGQTTLVSYWDTLRNFQPGKAIAKLNIPALILVGGHDAEVPPDDFAQWKQALTGRVDDIVKFYPAVFHLFMPSTSTKQGDDSPDDWMRPDHVAPDVVDDIASWIVPHKASSR